MDGGVLYSSQKLRLLLYLKLGKSPTFTWAPPPEDDDDAAAAEAALFAYQADPDGWAERQPNNDSMKVVSAGWYEQVLEFGPKN